MGVRLLHPLTHCRNHCAYRARNSILGHRTSIYKGRTGVYRCPRTQAPGHCRVDKLSREMVVDTAKCGFILSCRLADLLS